MYGFKEIYMGGTLYQNNDYMYGKHGFAKEWYKERYPTIYYMEHSGFLGILGVAFE